MEVAHQANSDQATLWNGPAGRAWVEMQELLDLNLKPFETMLVDAAGARNPADVLDIGCGTGATTLAIAQHLGGRARCVGVDLSEPMIALAQQRVHRDGSSARFIVADAQVHAFEPASFDMIVSRFGVMFFDDPVAAFANLRCAAKVGAELRFAAWRTAAENPFMTAAERAVAPLLPNLPLRPPGGPGQFAFAERDRVAAILKDSGWGDIEIEPVDPVCTFPESALVQYLTWMGPVGAMLQSADDATRAKILGALRPAFEPYVQGAEVRYTAACWAVTARATPA